MKKGSFVKTAVMSFQHMFAMLGATMLVPMLSGMSLPVALIAAGLGTILFYFITQKKVPVFLGSSFAFLPALISVVGGGEYAIGSPEWSQRMACAMIGLVLAGMVYVVFAIIIKAVGVAKVKKLFPPIVIGPVIITIGMILAPKMFWNNIIGNYDATLGWGGSTRVAAVVNRNCHGAHHNPCQRVCKAEEFPQGNPNSCGIHCGVHLRRMHRACQHHILGRHCDIPAGV